MNKFTITLLNFILILSLNANNDYWSEVNFRELNPKEAQIKTSSAFYISLDYQMLNNKLTLENNEKQTIEIPFPNGKFVSLEIKNNTSMAEGLKIKFPNIKTFNLENKSLNLKGKADITHKGLHVMLFTPKGTVFIDPYVQSSNKTHISYWKKDFNPNGKSFSCQFENKDIEDLSLQKSLNETNGTKLRTYKLAVSATTEYVAFHGGTKADGLAAVVTTMNRINGIYERDFSITLSLIADNDLIIYNGTDPFTNPNSAGLLINQNNNSLQSVIGVNNYDIGHVVGTGGSGLAGFGVVCNNNTKGRGTTGTSNPVGDPFDIDYVSHEIGHQFGGSHTFNGNDGACAGNISVGHNYEPGSASTIMGYAGICGSSNTQNFSDDYFHTHSLTQIINFSTISTGNNCAIKTETNNSIPVLDSYTNTGFTIPKSTPFELEAKGTDDDGDVITYCWEEYDFGSQGDPNFPVDNAALFRSFSPTESGIRTFPQISDILNQTQTIGEILPNYQRDMKFRITLRDGSGGTNYDDMKVIVDDQAGPFVVTSQNVNNISWTEGDQETIYWTVANTNTGYINCNGVDIFLSLDGGLSFPVVLKQNAPNNGNATIIVPGQASNNARIKVKGNNNIFFNINEKDFKINSACIGQVPSTVTISNNSTVLTSSYSGNNIWYIDGVIISNENGQTITATQVGTYTVMAENNDCISLVSQSGIEITGAILGVSNFEDIQAVIFPNPSNGKLNIHFTEIEKNIDLEIVDIVGKTVFSKTNLSQKTVLDIKHLTKGVYFVVLSNQQTKYLEKLILR